MPTQIDRFKLLKSFSNRALLDSDGHSSDLSFSVNHFFQNYF
ncbi:conserved protein of unknown function [Vibrio tapetis subsp. tapetis]|uniref:Uncharacterized protein n=1 Tax=Vibrio tapetis subsp. tapetis TaxID=1671868 RepID=A0A2N8ZH19_9VIBR|nr:conserved protein of unknown function [Vibrio tapetis subsp. tapetis]